MPTLTIYSTPHCQQCAMTKKVAARNNLTYIEEPLTDTLAEELRTRGLTTAPYVQVRDDTGELLDEWAGFRIEKIAYWARGYRD